MTSTGDTVAIVIGAAGTIGSVVARELAKVSRHLVLADRDASAVMRARDAVRALEIGCDVVIGDVGSPEVAAEYMEAALDGDRAPDVVVTCDDGPDHGRSLSEGSIAEFDEVLHRTLRPAFLAIRHALPIMSRRGRGSIVSVSSVLGLAAVPDQAELVAAHHGIVGLVRSAAAEAAPYGVRVNALCPGPVADTAAGNRTAEALARAGRPLAERVPDGSLVSAADIASAVRFLVSDDARLVNGEVLRLDGGLMMGR